MKYIELNPIRAKMVKQAEDYPWSSYASNAKGKPNAIITPHTLYTSLASASDDRLAAYQRVFNTTDKIETLENIESSILSGTPLGSKHFLKQTELLCHQTIGYNKQGRPRR